jgi:TonB family protein
VELPSAALDLPQNPPVFATPAYLPVLAAPPLKTDNLTPVASSLPASVTGRMEAAGFGAVAVTRAYSTHAPPSTMGGFSAATLEKVASPDPALPSRAGFGDASVSSTTLGTARMPSVSAQDASATPVEILEKPRPLYTDDARRLRLEGEVLVEALFPAAGPAKVLRVLRGLGHGLDQSAMAAVQGIRFRPAKRAGQAVDSSAIVHIVFQIAY